MKRVAFDLCQAGYCEHPEVVTIKGGSFKACQFPSLFGVIEHPDAGVLLYDTGYHPLYAEQTSRFPEGLYPRLMPAYLEPDQTAKAQLQRRGIAADDVTGIVISHFHGDHVAGLRDFPRAKFYALKSAFANVDGKSRWRNLLNGYLPGLLPDDFRERGRGTATAGGGSDASHLRSVRGRSFAGGGIGRSQIGAGGPSAAR